jgi:hypothetical protein
MGALGRAFVMLHLALHFLKQDFAHANDYLQPLNLNPCMVVRISTL